MFKAFQYFIFGDQSWPAESLAKALPPDSDVSLWIDGRGWVSPAPARQSVRSRQAHSLATALQHFDDEEAVQGEAFAIVGFQDAVKSAQVVEALKMRKSGIKILQVGRRAKASLKSDRRSVDWHELLVAGMDHEIQLLSIQDRVRELRELLEDAEKIAILLQEDPDPDGLASALALRKLLGRKPLSAPIVSFGAITRPENVAMARLLDIEVNTIKPKELGDYDKVVLVDCQPSFFKGKKIRADVVLDHHPDTLSSREGVLFADVREDFGATSTLMTEYLRAAQVEVSQRLATALLYGIKSDTLTLNREVSELDLNAFVFLYPRTNGNILRRIEHPELPRGYLEALRKGLRYLQVVKGVAVLPLPSVEREEWIPQAADFALQVEGARWALACGVFGDKVIISGRNCGYIEHCGELFKELFNGIGCAGGHRSMAKALIPRQRWIEVYGEESLSSAALAKLLARLVAHEVKEA